MARAAGAPDVVTDMPPTRFRVVERGRRLEVIDTQAGQAVTRRPDTPSFVADRKAREARPAWLARNARPGDGVVWTTHRFYDDKGPRRLTLDAGAMQQLQIMGAALVVGAVLWVALALAVPALWALPFILASGKSRAGLRGPITRWLDRIEAAGS